MTLGYLFKSFITGLLLSAGLSLFLKFGISLAYNYLLESILALVSLTVISSFGFWINIKCDQMFDVIDVFSKTISLDLKASQPGIVKLLRFIKPVMPYTIAFGILSGLLLMLLALPALIIYWAVHPAQPEMSLSVCAFLMSIGISILYYLSNREQFPSAAGKAAFVAGILLGLAGVIKVISCKTLFL